MATAICFESPLQELAGPQQVESLAMEGGDCAAATGLRQASLSSMTEVHLLTETMSPFDV